MSGENWDSYSHQELYDRIHGRAGFFGNDGAGVSGASGAQAGWGELATLMASAKERTEAALTKAGTVWEGDAASAMRSGVTPLAQWADDAHTAITASQTSTDGHVEAYSTAKNRMPEPVPVTSTANSDGLGIPAMYTHLLGGQTDQDQQEAAAQEAKAEAVRTMRHYENQSAFDRLAVGQFTPPPAVTVNVAPAQQPGGGDSIPVGVSEWSGPGRSPGDSAGSGADTPPSGPDTTPPPAGDSAPGRVSGSQATNPSTTPQATPPAASPPMTGPGADQYRPGATPVTGLGPTGGPVFGGTPGERGPAAGGRGYAGGGGQGLAGEGGRGAGGRGGGGVRGGVPGVGGLASEPVTGRTGTAGARGAGGMGMAPAGSRGEGDEDKEHFAAEYLRGTNDEFWDDTPPVAPAVIGEDED